MNACRICQNEALEPVSVRELKYYRCSNCEFIFLDEVHFLPQTEEKARYDTHNNDPEDERYRAFLSRLTSPLLSKLVRPSFGLDYGSGPGPTISLLMKAHGHEVKNYDPYYDKNDELLKQSYDFVTCSETAEHFYQPLQEFERLEQMLKLGAWLGIMTQMTDDIDDFSSWYYRNDPTHVGFYSTTTMKWLAEHFDWTADLSSHNVALFQKN